MKKPLFDVLPRLMLGLAMAMLLTACPAGLNPVSTADTNEQRAFALYGEYQIVLTQVADLVCGPPIVGNACPGNPAVSDDVKQAVKAMEARATPVAVSLRTAAMGIETIRQQIAAGTSTLERLELANQNLLLWINQLTPLVYDLKLAIKGK